MVFEVSEGAKNIIEKDLNSHNKYLKSGCKLGGSLDGDKLKLYIEDDFGKHSSFMSECFYGKFVGQRISGTFRIANYALALLIILFLVAAESGVMAVVNNSLASSVTPALIIAAEILYIFALRKQSKENNRIISEYLSKL